ncbi:unnamed protein product, partial [Tetraodon nigroviridis]
EQWSSYRNQCLDYLSSAAPSPGEPLRPQRELAQVIRGSPNRSPPQGWSVTGPLTCTPAGQMDFREPPSTCHAPGSCRGTAKFDTVWFTDSAAKMANGHQRIPASVRTTLQSNSMVVFWVSYGSCTRWATPCPWGLCYWPWQSSLPSGEESKDEEAEANATVMFLRCDLCTRKLHCMRNNIHMNLFASFILRAVSILVKDALLTLTLDSRSSDNTSVHTTAAMWCRSAMVLMQYSVIANNYWLLVEGIYLHSLLVITVFSEKKFFHVYMAIGWGAPLMFVTPWIAVKYLFENEECWERNINMGFWWIIRSPILFAYLINFFIFIRIIKILMSKLRAHQMRYTDYKFRLAKSTLTLIPLLGIHAILFTFVIDESAQKGSLLRTIRLFYDLLFNSFQGLLVAILYCFVNKEVQSEMLKKWKRWKLGKDIDEEYRHTHSQTPHLKSGSMATANLVLVHETNASEPSGDSPRLSKAREPLVLRCPAGEPQTGGLLQERESEGQAWQKQPALLLPCCRRPPPAASAPTTEDVCLEEKEPPGGGRGDQRLRSTRPL